MKKYFTLKLFIVLWTSLPVFLKAGEKYEFYRGIRALGMGGASVASVNDETALLLNPAALGKLRDFYGTVFDPEIEIGNKSLLMYKDQQFTDFYDLDSIKSSLDQNRGTYYHVRSQLFPSFVGKNFGIGIYSGSVFNAKMSSDGTTVDVHNRNDMGLVIGYNFRFFSGRIKWGFNTRIINRIIYEDQALPVSLTQNTDLTLYKKEGTGVAFDSGLILTAPWSFLPTISVVVRDIGGTKFDKSSGLRLTTTDQPSQIQQDADVAFAIFPIGNKRIRSVWTVQYSGLISGKNEEDKARLFHAGYELNLGDLFFLRAGYNQRYWTAGFELASEHFQIQAASYGEEVGTLQDPIEDRRSVLKVALRF